MIAWVWDPALLWRERQCKVTHNGNKIAEYFFDGEGKRVKKKVFDEGDPVNPTEETVFVYSNGKLIAEYSTAQPPPNPTTSYTATDQLGSPRVITNALGGVVSRRDFKPFGEQVAIDGTYRSADLTYNSGDGIRQKFTGYQKDEETQLDFAEARMYENRHGRFTAVDPLISSGKSSNPQTFNRYVYVGSNPLHRIDPQGLQWLRQGDSIFWVDDKDYRKYRKLYKDYTPLDIGYIFRLGNAEGPQFGENKDLIGKFVMLGNNATISEVDLVNEDGSPVLPSMPPSDYPAMVPGKAEDSGVLRLTWEWASGTGESERQFGPSSYMTQNMRTSPMLQFHRDRFISNGGGSYDSEIYSYATGQMPPYFGFRSAADDPVSAGSNMPRQFVGSFNIRITELRGEDGRLNGNALFEVQNPTSFNSFMYGSVAGKLGAPSWERNNGCRMLSCIGSAMGTTRQTFWWVETGVIQR